MYIQYICYCLIFLHFSFISYPRTETNMFPESFDLQAIVRDQTGDQNWGGQCIHCLYTQYMYMYMLVKSTIMIFAITLIPTLGFATQLLARGITPRQGNKTDNAHPPIHPTKYTNSLQVRGQYYTCIYM